MACGEQSAINNNNNVKMKNEKQQKNTKGKLNPNLQNKIQN
jgi:hypothetical protein